jgi:two-component system cell cycle response regulator
MNITIIEDTELEALYLHEILSNDGIEATVFVDSREGLEAVISEKPNLVFLDLHMPGIDGFEACKKLKTLKETSHIPIIIITASTRKEYLIQAFNVGADDFITKPLQDYTSVQNKFE